MNRLRFQSFGSGSSGNCYYVGTLSQGILIDAGIGTRNIKKYLKNAGLDFSNILGVFITHNHADHIKAVGSLGEKYHLPIYTTEKIHEGINRSHFVPEKLNGSKRVIEKFDSVKIGDFIVKSFPVSHDAFDSVGYTLEYQEKRFTFATDLGCIDGPVASQIIDSDFILLESNYDEQMLREGSYPTYLKDRISASTGHLSNDQTGRFLAENFREKWQHIFLCHLSRENNFPELAYSTVTGYLENVNVKIGESISIDVLDRFEPSELFVFD